MGGVYRQGRAPRVEVRRQRDGLALRIDGTFASWRARDGRVHGSVWEALAAPLLLLPASRRRRILVLGLGGGSAASVVRALAPTARVVGVERDPEVVRAARRWFELDALGLEVVQGDARAYLERSRRRFDAVLEDVFVGRGRAAHKPDWLPEPGLAVAARRLAPGGLLVSNALDEAPTVARALAARFPRVLQIAVADYDNRVLVGTRRRADARSLRGALARDPLLAPALPAFACRTLR